MKKKQTNVWSTLLCALFCLLAAMLIWLMVRYAEANDGRAAEGAIRLLQGFHHGFLIP